MNRVKRVQKSRKSAIIKTSCGIQDLATRREGACDAKTCAKAASVTGNGPIAAPAGCDRAAMAVNAWKTIAVGSYASPIALHDALVERGIHVGDLAGQMLRLPDFRLAPAPARIDLTLVSVGQLMPGSD